MFTGASDGALLILSPQGAGISGDIPQVAPQPVDEYAWHDVKLVLLIGIVVVPLVSLGFYLALGWIFRKDSPYGDEDGPVA
jgi:hypothetical protein